MNQLKKPMKELNGLTTDKTVMEPLANEIMSLVENLNKTTDTQHRIDLIAPRLGKKQQTELKKLLKYVHKEHNDKFFDIGKIKTFSTTGTFT